MFKYFGSKARLAPTYQPPQHDLIVEPFAGAAAYSMYWLHQRSDLRAVLVDSDPLVVEMWETLLAMTPEEMWNYPLPELGRSDDLIHLTATTGSSEWRIRARGDRYTITPWMVRDFPARRQKMAETLSRVRGRVEIERGDYTSAPDIEATWFIDPPYQYDGQWYDSGNDIDWPALGKWCRARSGQVIVCESLSADWLDFQPHTAHQNMTNRESVEVVWYSHPEPDLLSLMEAAET